MKIIEKILYENLPIDNDTFIFDIETTGLNPRFCKIILIGIFGLPAVVGLCLFSIFIV